MWDRILDTLSEEFSGSTDVESITRILARLLLAAVLGGILGYERGRIGKTAGLRTHMLVCMGSALVVLAPQQAGMTIADMSRVIQGVVAGIGFLGAGAIIKSEISRDVRGLTTAASVWMTSAIGISCGLGRESLAMLATVLALVVLALLPKMSDSNDER
jgi:putative Mg2+ transporter-C (MgtC) family protein